MGLYQRGEVSLSHAERGVGLIALGDVSKCRPKDVNPAQVLSPERSRETSSFDLDSRCNLVIQGEQSGSTVRAP